MISEALIGKKVKECADLIASGQVFVAGAEVRDPRWQVVLGEEKSVTVQGKPLIGGAGRKRARAHTLLLMHKPDRCLCERFRGSAAWCKARGLEPPAEGTAEDRERKARKRNCSSVYDFVPDELNHPSLGTFGRLDVDTTGLLLLGTDGGLQSLLMHPDGHQQKVYLATLSSQAFFRLRPTAPAEFAAGIMLANGFQCLPAKLEVVETIRVPLNQQGRCGEPNDDEGGGTPAAPAQGAHHHLRGAVPPSEADGGAL